MEGLYGGSNGKAWEQSRVKVYGWLEGSFNLSTSHDSNYPATYDIYANRVELDRAVLYVERLPGTVQTDHIDWGFHLSGLFGTSYRFTTSLGYLSGQLLGDHREYEFDPVLEYVDLYIPRLPRDSTSASAASFSRRWVGQLAGSLLDDCSLRTVSLANLSRTGSSG
jgi:hypothetical protein